MISFFEEPSNLIYSTAISTFSKGDPNGMAWGNEASFGDAGRKICIQPSSFTVLPKTYVRKGILMARGSEASGKDAG